MTDIALFRQLVQDARSFLEATVSDVTTAQASWLPGGTAPPINAQYAHIVVSQDMGLHGLLKGIPPLAASSWTGKTGMSELPPPFGQPWDRWARQAKFDLAKLRSYAQAVYAASDKYFASLTEAEFNRSIDLSAAGFGQQPASFALINGWITNVSLHCGEIACLKGLQGATGYPI